MLYIRKTDLILRMYEEQKSELTSFRLWFSVDGAQLMTRISDFKLKEFIIVQELKEHEDNEYPEFSSSDHKCWIDNIILWLHH